MKRLLIVLVMSLSFVCLANAQSRTRGGQLDLVGPVKSVQVEEAILSYKSGKWVEGRRIRRGLDTYDNVGNVTESIWYDPDGSLSTKRAYTYDPKGNKIEERYFEKASLTQRYVYSYVPEGKKTNMTKYDAKGSIIGGGIYTYDAIGNMTEEISHYNKGALESKRVITYDASGRKLGEVYNGRLTYRYTYDTTGKSFEKSNHDAKGNIESKLLQTQTGRNAVEITYYKPANLRCWNMKVTYDKHGSLIEKEFDGAAGHKKTEWTYVYEYDSNSNWVKKTNSYSSLKSGEAVSEPAYAESRIITYYSDSVTPRQNDVRDLTEWQELTKGVIQGTSVVRVEPYPQGALTGSVRVEITIDEDGNVLSARAISGPSSLQGAAVAAARRWKFEPTLLSGDPIKLIGTLTFNFK